MKRFIYMDHAATTPAAPEVIEAMKPYLRENYGNPSGLYELAKQSRRAVEEARAEIARTLHVPPETIYFTSGGTESDNWALSAVCAKAEEKGRRPHMITTKIEHHAVLNTCAYLERHGADVTYIGTDETGLVDFKALSAAIRPETVLISVMAANNEVGTIEPLEAIGALAASRQILFHTDAVQAYGHMPLNVQAAHISMLSASAHKFNGPKGVGFLYVEKPEDFEALMHGGGQEMWLRAGTENVAGIVGMGCAAKLSYKRMALCSEKEQFLRDRLIYRLCSELPFVRLNGNRKVRLPNNASFCFAGADSASMIAMLDMAGICVSGGSACASGSARPSHVLRALGLTENEAATALRLTVSDRLTIEDIDYTVMQIKKIVNYLRQNENSIN